MPAFGLSASVPPAFPSLAAAAALPGLAAALSSAALSAPPNLTGVRASSAAP